MIVDQIDAFKTWLTAVLKPMCEADPAALAKYVLALIKKDKSEEELRKSMVDQLDVFLETETENFVNLVFQTLATKDYIVTPVIPNTNPPNPNIIKPPKELKETKVIVQPSELPNLNETVNGAAAVTQTDVKEAEPVSTTVISKEKVPLATSSTATVVSSTSGITSGVTRDVAVKARRNSENEREERPPRRRSRHRSLSRNRSRSRSWDRTKRSRSREKSREREQYRLDREKRDRPPRAWRQKSPPPNRRYEQRRRSPSLPRELRGGRSRSRSPVVPRHSHRSRYGRGMATSRSRSRSLEKRTDKKEKEHSSRPGTPTHDSNHGDNLDIRLTSSSQSVSSVVVQPDNGAKRRCRDFDIKGYCMRGEMCPFDHGVDPVVLEDAALSRVLTYNPNGTTVDATASAVLPTPMLTAPGHPLMMGQRLPPPVVDNPYVPQPSPMWRDGRFRGPRPMMAPARLPGLGPFAQGPNLQRELIPVPVMDNNKHPLAENYNPNYTNNLPHHHVHHLPPGYHGMDSENNHHNNMYNNMKKKPFDFNRLGPRAKMVPGNCSLELKKVPTGLNSITHLNNHFAKFGKIVNIQVQFEGDNEAALITFSTHAEANAAYRSTEAVLNNRFIKVFWHNPDVQAKVAAMEENSANNNADDKQRLQKEIGKEVNELNKEDSKAQATAAVKKSQDLLAAQVQVKKNQDEQRKEVLKIQSDLRKRKQELLDKQLSQQKILIEKMEKLPPGPQRDVIMETIKKTQEVIEGIKKDLEQAALAVKPTSQKKTKEEAQKELLDTELDLIAKQQEGADTTELQKKLLELRAKYGTSSIRGRGRGRARYVPIVSRHLLSKNNLTDHSRLKSSLKLVNKPSSTIATPLSAPTSTTLQKHAVDHRPTRLLVSGYETDEQDGVLKHFQQYGEVLEYTIDSSLPSITLSYKTRKDAETALLKGKHFQDRTLSITWSNVRLQTQRSGGSSTRTVLLSESEEEHLIDQSLLEGDEELGPEISEEALLQDDEDEDEEDRSWRR